MTTFAFANVEATYQTSTGSLNHGEQTIYTVPSGKLAKIKFDSFHMSINGTSNKIEKLYWVLYSQNSGATTLRKHMVGEGFTDNSNVRTISFYNPADFTTVPYDKGGTISNPSYGKTMNAVPENFPANNTPQNINDSLREHQWNTQGYGTFTHGPETFFMGAGEVLKLRAKDSLSAGANRFTNMRCAIWLEDV